ncbi:MAG: NAD(P)H-hydrate dehydratase [Deltaproteobacteria bacterium]|nr:NAD(P)H-hydrate dehydratase [Deltaproteobacteria bacterium]
MNRVLSREQIRAFDRVAIDDCKVPGLVLMENAGRGAAEVIWEHLPNPHARVIVVCGAGNNGGDGFVVARHLDAYGALVTVWFIGDPDRLKGDALANHDAWVGLGKRVLVAWSLEELDQLEAALAVADVIVDAIFGTGLDREVKEPFSRVIDCINETRALRFALDLPSGLDANTGAPLGVAVRAHHTITFGALKLGLLTPTGAEHCGSIHVAQLGVPGSLIDQTGHDGEVITTAAVAAWLKPRAPSTHKHGAGNVLVVAGAPGKIGASLLAAQGALRAGAGLATIASWPEAVDALQSRVLEIMTARLDADRIEASLEEALQGRGAVAVGPGFGTDERAVKAIEHVVLRWDGPKVVDADAITAFAGRAEALASAKGKLILTPHPGEMGRLLGISRAQVEADRFSAVREAVRLTGAIVVLKGAHSLVGVPGAPVAINTAGAPTLATAGSGDVLCGLIAAFACSLQPSEAAIAGVHVHGLCGEAWAREHRVDRGMIAGEIAQGVPDVLAKLAAGES